MDENQIPESNHLQSSQKTNLKEHFTTVTPVSKFLAMVLFVALPFLGFLFGLNYQDTNTLSGESTVIPTLENEVALQETEGTDLTQRVADSANIGDDAFLERLRLEYPDFFSAPEDYSFEWRWRDSSGSISSPPNISKIQGKVLSTSEFSFQDLWLGEQSLLYQIENTLPSFFAQEGFTQATANDADHPTNGSSVQGYERMSDGTVCLRIIEDTESEFLNYKIVCGTLVGSGSSQSSSFSVGQYIEWEGKVSEYVQDCGGGENCLSYLRISLSENMITDSIFEARINIENCVDKSLRGGETVKVTGRVQNVVPDIGLILSCADAKTSVTRKEEAVAKELDVTSQPAYLVGMYMSEGKYYAELDYVEWLHGEEQLQAMIEDGQCLGSGADCYVYPNGYKRNKNPLIHSVPLASNVAIELAGYIASFSGGYGASSFTVMTLTEFAQVIQSEISTSNRQTNEFRNPITFVKVDIKDGSITRIVEPYQE